MKLNNVMLGSKNPKTLTSFYAEFLGKPGWGDGEWSGFAVGTGGLMIGPHSEAQDKNPSPAQIIIGFETDDVKADFERIKAVGATVIAEPYQPSPEDNPGIWLATFADPDGNYFQLASPWEA